MDQNRHKMSRFLPVLLLMTGIAAFTACSSTRPLASSRPGNDLSQKQARDHYLSGALFDFENQYKQAIVEYHQALQYDSSSAQILKAIGRNFVRLNQRLQALNYLQRSYQRNPRDRETLHYLAETHYSLRQYEQAAAYYEELIELDPYNETIYTNLIYLYTQLGRVPELIALRERMVEVTGYDHDAVVQLWSLYMQFDRVEAARKLVRRLVTEWPDDPANWVLSGTTLALDGDTSAAISAFMHALELDQRHEEALNQLFALYAKQEDWSGLIAAFRKIVAADSGNGSARLLLAEGYFYAGKMAESRETALSVRDDEQLAPRANLLLGRIAASQNALPEAKIYFRELTRKTPGDDQAWEFLAILYLQSGELDSSAALLQEALVALPYHPRLLSLYGGVLQQQGRYQAALSPLEKAYRLDPDDLSTISTLGLVYDALKMYSQLDSLYESALRKFPDNALLLNNYSYSLGVRGVQLERALEMARRALAREPGSAAYHDTVGWIFFQMGDYQKARDYILKSLEIQPDNPEVVEHMGDIFEKLGEREKAREYWQNALRLQPDNPALQEKLQQNPQ